MADVLVLNPYITHNLSLQSLRKRINETSIWTYLLKRSFLWQSFFSKVTTLTWMKNFAGKRQEHLLELNLHHFTLLFLWMKCRRVFLKHNNCSHSFGSDISMTNFLYGHTATSNLIQFSKILTKFIQIWNLLTKHLKIVLIF